jgi:hypothetical protein
MTSILGLIIDAALIAVVGVGIVQAIRLIRQLKDLSSSRADIEKFVREFNSAVYRAEAGVKTLRSTARESGDDLEKLIEKARMARDELTILIESADSMADRLSSSATKAVRADAPETGAAPKAEALAEHRAARKPAVTPLPSPALKEKASLSRAEQELIQALKKLG